jgi:3,4-dihydroxy 2-butanone 4-phosphate synthase/GTP cyclohydrolase II
MNLINEFQAKELAILQDDEGGLRRAVLVAPASTITAEKLNKILTITSGLPFVALSSARMAAFALPPMSSAAFQKTDSSSDFRPPNMSVSVEAREGVSTGISMLDRAKTIAILAHPTPQPRLIVKPGHIFPIEVHAGGVLARNCIPEASFDLVQIALKEETAFFCDLLDEDGELLSDVGQKKLSRQEKIPLIRLSQIVRHRLENENLVERGPSARLPTKEAGELSSVIFRSKLNNCEHFALVKGEINPDFPILTRVQPESTLADVFGGIESGRKCISAALKSIGQHESGVLVYLRKADRGSLKNQITEPLQALPARSAAMMREYGIGAQILRSLGIKKIVLLTNSQKNLSGLTTFGLEITAQRQLQSSHSAQELL